MNILYLTQTFPPSPGATVRPLEQARCLIDHGHAVTVLTTFPYYPTGRLPKGDRLRILRREIVQGVPVIRVWSMPAPKRGWLRRSFSFASFAASSMVVGSLVPRPDVVIASLPQPLTELGGLVLARAGASLLVIELRDLFPEVTGYAGIRTSSRRFGWLRRYFHAIYRAADLVAVAGAEMIPSLTATAGVSPERVVHIPHGIAPGRFARAAGADVRRRLGMEDCFVVVYAGSLGRAYGVTNIVRSATHLREHRRIRIVVIGCGGESVQIERLVTTSRLDNVVLIRGVPPDTVVDFLAAADAFVFSFHHDEAIGDRRTLTTKMCDYLAVGRPILVVERHAIAARAVEAIGAGHHVPAEDPRALADAILTLTESPGYCQAAGERGREYAQVHLHRARTMGPLLRWLDHHTHVRGAAAREPVGV